MLNSISNLWIISQLSKFLQFISCLTEFLIGNYKIKTYLEWLRAVSLFCVLTSEEGLTSILITLQWRRKYLPSYDAWLIMVSCNYRHYHYLFSGLTCIDGGATLVRSLSIDTKKMQKHFSCKENKLILLKQSQEDRFKISTFIYFSLYFSCTIV